MRKAFEDKFRGVIRFL